MRLRTYDFAIQLGDLNALDKNKAISRRFARGRRGNQLKQGH